MKIEKMINGELNFFKLNEKLNDKQKVELLYYTLTGLYEFDSEYDDFEKYMEFVQSEVRELLTYEIIGE
jgi:hypothetical protein